jgi:hypothetical protein
VADARINALTEATSLDDTDWLVAEVGDSEARKVSVATLATAVLGYELDYVEITSPVSISATSAATADTCITGSSVAYDGSTRVCIEVYSPQIETATTAGSAVLILLYDGSTQVGLIGVHGYAAATAQRNLDPHFSHQFLTPSAASHTYSVRAYRAVANSSFGAGAGGSDTLRPAYIRITKA